MSDTKYNGWTNYATWRINLEICDDLIAHAIGEQTFPDVDTLRSYLEDSVDDVLTNYGENESGLALDYARAFVSDVNFHEITESAIADNPELIEREMNYCGGCQNDCPLDDLLTHDSGLAFCAECEADIAAGERDPETGELIHKSETA